MALVSITLAAAYWLTQPPRITMGYVEGDAPETQILKAFQVRLMRERKPPFKLTGRGFAGPAEIRAAFSAGEIDLAPFATWETVPDTAETVAILQRTRVLLVALNEEQTRRGAAEKIVLVAADDMSFRLGSLIMDAAFEGSAQPPTRLTPAEAARALQSGSVEIAVIAAPNGTKQLRQLIAALPATEQSQISVRAAPRADQLTRQNAAIESVELKVGAASSDPLLPDEDIETLSVTTRLMARRDLSESVVTDVTRLLLSQQRRLAQITPAATQLEPPPSERGAAFPTHQGAAAYVDSEERSFFERYGDWLYLVLFGGSGLGSILAAFASWRDGARRRDDLKRLGTLHRLVAETAGARSMAEVADATDRHRAIMSDVILASTRLEVAQTDLAAFTMASALFQEIRRERVEAIEHGLGA